MSTEPTAAKYRFIREIRPFSYSVALITCGLGALQAYLDGVQAPLRTLLVLLAGVLLQVAVNLINNYGERHYWFESVLPEAALALARIRRNNRIGLACGLIGALIGVYLVLAVGWPLLLLGVIGLVGAYGYTGAPIDYKSRGLGVVLVFWLMGVLMVCGSYYAVSGQWSAQAFWLSLPISMLSSALLLSNELRDLDEDRAQGIATLSVRIGFKPALALYLLLLLGVYPLGFAYLLAGWLANGFWLLPSMALLWPICRCLQRGAPYTALPPWSGRHFMLFGVGFLLALL